MSCAYKFYVVIDDRRQSMVRLYWDSSLYGVGLMQHGQVHSRVRTS